MIFVIYFTLFTNTSRHRINANVTAKPVTFLHGTNRGCTVVSHVCSCNTLTVTGK